MVTLPVTSLRFQYQATDENGLRVVGYLDAADRDAAMQTLAQQYPLVVSLQEVKSRAAWWRWRKSLTSEQCLNVLQQLSVATAAGVQLKSCLDTMAQDGESPELGQILRSISTMLGGGATLSEAASSHPKLFAHYQCMMIRAGEASGKLPEVLAQLADELEAREVLAGQLRAATSYPLFVLCFAFALALAMLAWGIPQVNTIYVAMGAKLPLATQVLVNIGLAFSQGLPLCLVLLVTILWGGRRLLHNESAQRWGEGLLLAVPLLGPLYRMYCVAGFSRTLGMLYRGGLRLDQAMEIAVDAHTSPTMRGVIAQMRCHVTQGEMLSLAVRSTGFFPPLAAEMITTGESSGCLDRMLAQLSHFYSRRCELGSKSLTALLEPVLSVLIGLILGGLILALALPFLTLPGLVS